MAKEKATKDTAKQAKDKVKTTKSARKTTTAKSGSKAASVASGRRAKDAAKPVDEPVEEPTRTTAARKSAATAAAPMANPADATETDAKATRDDLVDNMTTVSTSGEISMEVNVPEVGSGQSADTEEGSRRKLRPKVQYSDAELDEFREIIEKTRQEAVEEFQILRQNLEDITNSELADENASYSMHMAEQGTEAQEKEKIYAQVQRLNDYIKKLDEALQRIKDKTYGICRVCGILIAKERLLAVPITTLSASYKIQKKCPEDGVDRIIAPK